MESLSRHRAQIVSTHTPALFEAAVAQAAELLRAGQLVALPTETVYGLAANALDPKAVAAIFKVKGRPARNPIIVHVASVAMARRCVSHWPGLADKLAAAFWPGPLTLVLPRSDVIPDIVTAGGPTVGVRWPSHPFIQAVIRACDFPLAAPSANPSSRVSATTAEHVAKSLGDKIPLVVDGGQTSVGIESTVLDLSTSPPQLLRPGMVEAESLQALIGALVVPNHDAAKTEKEPASLRSPGLLKKHYAPRAKLVVWEWRDDLDLEHQIRNLGYPLRQVQVLAHTRIPRHGELGRVIVMARDPKAFARLFYTELHRCDDTAARLIVVETPPKNAGWHAIADRLRRAAAEE
ncbi:MAG: L-threonylcarbamoyladenylate synthase [Candidatus Omnitrophica bacterium]|nr:L-threonylcarbamoyladenylate synthase [Candidatus Omnitrophota bacterium]